MTAKPTTPAQQAAEAQKIEEKPKRVRESHPIMLFTVDADTGAYMPVDTDGVELTEQQEVRAFMEAKDITDKLYMLRPVGKADGSIQRVIVQRAKFA